MLCRTVETPIMIRIAVPIPMPDAQIRPLVRPLRGGPAAPGWASGGVPVPEAVLAAELTLFARNFPLRGALIASSAPDLQRPAPCRRSPPLVAP